MIVFFVLFAAPLSEMGLAHGFLKGDNGLFVAELVMIAIWAQMEYSNYKKRAQ